MKKSSRGYPRGTKVRSHYSSTWSGVVVASGRDVPKGWVTRDGREVTAVYGRGPEGQWLGPKHPDGHTPIHHIPHPGCVLVKVTHDRKGNPLRKPIYKVLDHSWLEVIS